MNLLLDIWRHGLPLVSLYALHGDIAAYLLLTAFDLSLGLIVIVGTTRDRNDPTTVDPRSRSLRGRVLAVLSLAIFFAIVSAIITIPIGMPALILGLISGADWRDVFLQRNFWGSIALMSVLAATRAQRWFESTTRTTDDPAANTPVGNLENDRKRSIAANAAQVTLIGTFLAVSYALVTFGRWGLYAFPTLYAALLVFYDARPDIGEQVFPDLWRQNI